MTELGRDAGKALGCAKSPGENEGSKPLGTTGGVIMAKDAEERLSDVVSALNGIVSEDITW